MNVVSIIALTILISLLQIGCSPVKVSLNSEFGLSLEKTPIEEPPPVIREFTIIGQPSFINAANVNSYVIDGTCKNVETIQIKVNNSQRTTISCSSNYWEADFNSSADSDGDIIIEFIDQDSKASLHTLSLKKDVVPPIAVINATIPALNNLTDVPVSITEFIGTVMYSYKIGLTSAIDCADPDGYSNYMTAETDALENISGDGNYRLCLIGKDSFENEQSYANATIVNWQLDTVIPTLAFSTATSVSVINNDHKTAFSVTITCSDADGAVKLIATDKNSLEISNLSTCASATSTATYAFDTTTLADGTIKFSAIHKDIAGNSTALTTVLTVTKDVIAPVFTATIDDGSYFSSLASSPLITWAAATDTDGTGILGYEVGFGTTNASPDLVPYASVSASLTVQKAFSTPLTENSLYYTFVKAFDAAGNSSTQVSDGWKPDVTIPTLSSMNDGLTSPAGFTPSLSWTAGSDGSLGSGISKYEFAIGTTAGASDIFSWSSTGTSTTAFASVSGIVIGGSYFASIRAVDKAGNISSVISGDGFFVKPTLLNASVVSNNGAFAAIMTNGKVICWGDYFFGGDYAYLPTALKTGPLTAVKLFSNYYSFAALMNDGSVISWGNAPEGGDSSAVASELDGTIDVTHIVSSRLAFAALRTDGKVFAWGRNTYGGTIPSAKATLLDGTIAVTGLHAAVSAFAARRIDGSVVAWGNTGGDTSAVDAELDGTIDVTNIFTASNAFIALRANGSLVSWGDYGSGGPTFSSIASQVNGTIPVIGVHTTNYGAAALRNDGTIITWGSSSYGGDSSAVISEFIGVNTIFSNQTSFAALRGNGSIVTWGDGASGGDSSAASARLTGIPNKVTSVSSTSAAFAAILENGSVVLWGHSAYGAVLGSLSPAAVDGTTAVVSITGSQSAFAAIRADGSAVSWGNSVRGGSSAAVAAQLDGVARNVVKIYSNPYGFTAIFDDGQFTTWGDSYYGGDSSTVNPNL